MLVSRLRHRPNIGQTLVQRVVFAGMAVRLCLINLVGATRKNTRCHNVGSMSSQCRKRWANIKPALSLLFVTQLLVVTTVVSENFYTTNHGKSYSS